MILRLLAACLLSLSFVASAAAPDKPMIVLFYADWCYNCKILLPKLTQAEKGLENDLVLVKLDSTNEDRKAESRQKAKDLGISSLWFSNHATGWAALFDAKHQRVGDINQDMSVDELRTRLATLAGRPELIPAQAAPAVAAPVAVPAS